MLHLKPALPFADAALAQDQNLSPGSERIHDDGPFLNSDPHKIKNAGLHARRSFVKKLTLGFATASSQTENGRAASEQTQRGRLRNNRGASSEIVDDSNRDVIVRQNPIGKSNGAIIFPVVVKTLARATTNGDAIIKQQASVIRSRQARKLNGPNQVPGNIERKPIHRALMETSL